MRISDWSSDVCSSDLRRPLAMWRREVAGEKSHRMLQRAVMPQTRATHIHQRAAALAGACVQIEIKARQHVAIGVQYIVIAYVRVPRARKSDVKGTRVAGRVVLGGRRLIKKT